MSHLRHRVEELTPAIAHRSALNLSITHDFRSAVVPDEVDRACPRCLEPGLVIIEAEEVEQEGPQREESPDDELLRCTEEAFREQFAGRLPVAAARLETLADKLRADL